MFPFFPVKALQVSRPNQSVEEDICHPSGGDTKSSIAPYCDLLYIALGDHWSKNWDINLYNLMIIVTEGKVTTR